MICTSLLYIAMKTHQGYVTPWIASQIDLLSEDWETINTKEDLIEDAIEIQRILSKGYRIGIRGNDLFLQDNNNEYHISTYSK